MCASPAQKSVIGITGFPVVEGVMFRSPHFLTLAIRIPSGKIWVWYRPFRSFRRVFSWARMPIIRGIVYLLESLSLGFEAFSLSVQASRNEKETVNRPQDRWKTFRFITATLLAIVLGLSLFVVIPDFFLSWFTNHFLISPAIFSAIDATIKSGILILGLLIFSLLPYTRNLLRFHVSEHQSLNAFEAGQELTFQKAFVQPEYHPACGVSFLLLTTLITTFAFSFFVPNSDILKNISGAVFTDALIVGIKIILFFPIAGISYEIIHFVATRPDSIFSRIIDRPLRWLQKITLHSATESQLEVGLAALRQTLRLEKGISGQYSESSFEIEGLNDIGTAHVHPRDFEEK